MHRNRRDQLTLLARWRCISRIGCASCGDAGSIGIGGMAPGLRTEASDDLDRCELCLSAACATAGCQPGSRNQQWVSCRWHTRPGHTPLSFCFWLDGSFGGFFLFSYCFSAVDVSS